MSKPEGHEHDVRAAVAGAEAGRAIFPRVRGPEGVAPREQSRRWRMSAVQCAAAARVFCVTV